MERAPCVYIMASRKHGALYIGVTSDLLARVQQYRMALTPGFTTRYNITKLVYFEQFERMDDAIAREKQLKNWHRDGKTNLIERDNPQWFDLAGDLGLGPASQDELDR